MPSTYIKANHFSIPVLIYASPFPYFSQKLGEGALPFCIVTLAKTMMVEGTVDSYGRGGTPIAEPADMRDPIACAWVCACGQYNPINPIFGESKCQRARCNRFTPEYRDHRADIINKWHLLLGNGMLEPRLDEPRIRYSQLSSWFLHAMEYEPQSRVFANGSWRSMWVAHAIRPVVQSGAQAALQSGSEKK